MDFENETPNDEPTENDIKSNAKHSSTINAKKVIRRPRNILRVDHLVSRRGIAALPEIISQTKFKGKGHELEDLKLLLFKTKHWAHRLFPNLTFEDFVAKTESLGNKRTVKNFLNRIRTNQPVYFTQNPDLVHSEGSDDEFQNSKPNDEPINNGDYGQATLNYDLLFKDHIDAMNKKNAEQKQVMTSELNNNDQNENDFLENIDDNDFEENQEDYFPNNNNINRSLSTNSDQNEFSKI